MSTHLILGGARSGKSAYAERLAAALELPVTYIATAQVYDDEFAKRVAHHKERRPPYWQLVEAPFTLGQTLLDNDAPETCLIVDCLTLWLAQCICPDCDKPRQLDWQAEKQALLDALPQLQATVFLVSNEVGMGIVPLGEINRQFQDEQGRLNQHVAALADHVSFMAAGLPLKLK
ncbi:adenosylcobinamide kinase /adenosylcobinamide-phosphate guanylyltransferase [Methylophilus rhizosphaerae]|uniref:Bifunctional adenosylcobalamin biosynthesis protein n=1 Tax=Methylophilus rhizosphaerae TaxID=492660 RepID=A0A1G9DVZ7_9PROT|nr:bifunctional adenosylcobinamide kinase/adenosylcobinamide-phosphate guanylyltransferase [Methylophilus rhizosphaerae]SDK68039.1 adenosylcobinamide kinase /adenosylcobinamide-phosphate guanylyltransferase [Methylophilus rhizosphaerae]